MDELTTTTGIVALAAGAVALAALFLALVLALRIRRLRATQAAVLGGAEQRDLVAHAERLGRGFEELRDWVEETAERLEGRVSGAETRIDGCIAYRSLVRYDAYGEMTGRQSSSVALLDAHRSGVILSSILHRDHARFYVKQVHAGESELELSPEEIEAMETALGSTRA